MTTSAYDRIVEDIGSLQASAEGLDRSVMDANSTDLTEALTLLRQLREIIKLLRQSEHALERWVDEVFRDQEWTGPVHMEGIGRVEVRRSKGRKGWDHQALLKDWFESWMASRGTGEMPSPWEVRDALNEAAGIGYWRVGVLKQLGLDPNEYSTTEPGPPTVQIS